MASARPVGHHGVGLRAAAPKRLRARRSTSGEWTWCSDSSSSGGHAHPGGDAAAIFGDLVRIVVRADADVEAAVDALGDAAGPREEAVANAGVAPPASSSGRSERGPAWICIKHCGRCLCRARIASRRVRRYAAVPQDVGGGQCGRRSGPSQSASAEGRQCDAVAEPTGQHLEQFAHLASGPASRSTRRCSRSACLRSPARAEPAGAFEKPRPSRNSPWCHQCAVEAVPARAIGQARRNRHGGEVGLAGIGERRRRSDACAPPAACRRSRLGIAVVDEQCRAPPCLGDARRNRAASARCGPARSRRSAPSGAVAAPGGSKPGRGAGAGDEGELAGRIEPDAALAPRRAALTNCRIGTASKSSLPTMQQRSLAAASRSSSCQ